MPIADKTRKILWGRSGNRCAICKTELIIDANAADDESVVADECHIISPKAGGPRHDPSYPLVQLDSYKNLILLCRLHHKMIDDQIATYTKDTLLEIKANHELWVSHRTDAESRPNPLKLRRSKDNIPAFLIRVTTGKAILNITTDAMSYSFDHDELKSQEEVDLVGSFLQLVADWGDMAADLDAGACVQTSYSLSESLQELEQAGFWLFGGREIQILEGGHKEAKSEWPVAIFQVLRKDNALITKLKPSQND